tara:strand:+ start:120 stop:335 length:216 start_codon:yes stop_codon:yes gene_type:complete
MKIDKILKDLLSQDDGLLIAPEKKQLLFENWELVTPVQKQELLRLLDREGLYKQAMLKIEVEAHNLITKDE